MKLAELTAIIKDTVKSALDAQVAAHSPTVAPLATLASRATSSVPAEKGSAAVRFLMAYAAGRGDLARAAQYAEQQWGGQNEVALALGTATIDAGGALVPQNFSADVIELLRPLSAITKMSPIRISLDGGNLTLPKLSGGATATYGAENAATNATEQTFGDIKMTFHPLRCIVPVSNQLLRYGTNVEMVVREDMLSTMATRMDVAFIRGTGASDEPKGIRYWASSGNVFGMVGSDDLTGITDTLRQAVLKLKTSNSRMLRPGWLMSPRSEQRLITVRTSNGPYAFREEMLMGKLWGFPYACTNNILENLGGGANESELYLADFADVVIGESRRISVDTSAEAAYNDSSGTVQSAFSRDQTVLRVILEHDLAVRHPGSVSVVTGLTWGV